jgi:AhpD family alkylhydroperoxidase
MASSDPDTQMEWGECWLEPTPMPRDLTAEIRRLTGGIVPSWATHTASVPWVGRAFALVTRKHVAYMPLPLFGLIALVVSQDNSCRYCYGATRTILRVLGYTDEQVDRVARDVHLSDLTRPEQVALEFARKVSHANPRATAFDREALARAGYAPPAVAEIAYIAAFQGFPNRVATFLALPSERFFRMLDHPLARLVRPLIAPTFRGRHAPAEPAPTGTGPVAEIVAALGDSPTARAVRTVVDDALASPVLPRRTKLLMLAVIGRALGCDHSEDEARTGLAGDGLAPDDVDEILANLGSPKLDRRDALLVPFARETVRYQTGAIQRLTRELAQELPTDQVIEAVGIAALANSLGRLSIVLETC